MRRAKWLFPALLALAAVSRAAGPAWDVVRLGPKIELPGDLAAHPSFQTEWWYATGLVTDPEGRRYGVQWTLFRRGMDPSEPQPGQSALRPRQVLSGHLAVADLREKRFVSGQRVRRVGAGLAGWGGPPARVWLEDWTFEALSNGRMRLSGTALESDLALELELSPSRPAVLQGEGGYSLKGIELGNASAYFTLTRCAARGRLEIGGRTASVSGMIWFDREWGTTRLDEGVAGWDWFGLRLEDGRDLMVYRLRKPDGFAAPGSSGTLTGPDGKTRVLGPGDFSLEPVDFWESPLAGARYPVRWRLILPSAALDLEVRAPVEGCEVDGLRSTGSVYWEGPAEVSGSVRGEGYMELTGYAAPLVR